MSTITASVKLTPDEMGELRYEAKIRHMTISDYIRAALAAMKPKPKPPKLMLKRHPVSGGWHNAAPGQANPTQEELDAALKDYL